MSHANPARITIALAALAACLSTSMLPTMAAAQGTGTVIDKSRYSTKRVSAPVRPGPHGYQVRLPGGTWVDCKRDCGQTLREETVDFWQTMREKSRR